jgi:glycosyltransferase involved in cell wall biosynthesis
MKNLHFVYVLPGFSGWKFRIKNIFKINSSRNFDSFHWNSPLRAPYSITYHLGKSLNNNWDVKYYDWCENGVIIPDSKDILLGHLSRNRGILRNSLTNNKFRKKFLIQPFNNDESQVGWIENEMKNCDGFFAISGDYWKENIHNSPLIKFHSKMIYVNMAINSNDYPFVKTEFNKIGNRRFFYIGRRGGMKDEKGIKLLEDFARHTPGFKGGYICGGCDIKGWEKICSPTDLNQVLMEKIAQKYDIFINMSRADAQATTILEAMSWGFPVACTKESGYCNEENFFYLSLDDMDHNKKVFDLIQNISDLNLSNMAKINREIVNSKYSWNVFVDKISNIIKE